MEQSALKSEQVRIAINSWPKETREQKNICHRRDHASIKPFFDKFIPKVWGSVWGKSQPEKVVFKKNIMLRTEKFDNKHSITKECIPTNDFIRFSSFLA